MNLRILRYYLMICQEKNITQAANKLHVSQPTLSKQIKELEDQLGVTLFERGHRKIKLTEAGYFLRDRAQELVSLADNTIQTLESAKIISGTLRISTGQSVALKPVMKALNHLTEEYPNVKLQFTDANADQIEYQVNNGLTDFGIVMGNRSLDEFDSLPLYSQNQFVVAFNKNLPLAQKDAITAADLIDYPLIMSSQSHVSDKFKNWFGNLYPQLKIVATSNLAYSGALFASQGNNVLITYSGLIDAASHDLVIRPLSPEISDQNTLIWKKNIRLTNLGQKFLEQLQDQNYQ